MVLDSKFVIVYKILNVTKYVYNNMSERDRIMKSCRSKSVINRHQAGVRMTDAFRGDS